VPQPEDMSRLVAFTLLAALIPASAAWAAPVPATPATRRATVTQRLPRHRARTRFQTAIVGGTNAAQGTLGFMAFVAYLDPSARAFACSGTVVSPNVILTAAHCAVDEKTGARLHPADFGIVTGALDVTAASSGQLSSVSKIIVDPAYSAATASSDAALLVLSKPISAPTVVLATSADLALNRPGTGTLIAGWGKTSGSSGSGSALLQWASTAVQSPDYCSQYYAHYDASVHLCTVNPPTYSTATCAGDSGGPLIAREANGAPVEIGLTSTGPSDCNTTTADLFTAVAPLSDWVHGVIRAAAAKPSPSQLAIVHRHHNGVRRHARRRR